MIQPRSMVPDVNALTPKAEAFPLSSSRDTSTRSGSRLLSSESEISSHQHPPWNATDGSSDHAFSKSRSRNSPVRRQDSTAYNPSPYSDSNKSESIFTLKQNSGSRVSLPSQKHFLDPTTQDFVVPDMARTVQYQYPRDDGGGDAPYSFKRADLSAVEPTFPLDRASKAPNLSGHNSDISSRNGSLPPSRGDVDPPVRLRGDISAYQSTRYGLNAGAQRINSSTQASSMMSSSQSRYSEQQNPTRMDNLTNQLDHLNLYNPERRPSFASSQHSPNSTSDHFPNVRAPVGTGSTHNQWSHEDFLQTGDQLSPTGSASGFSRPGKFRGGYNGQYSQSPGDSDSRPSHHSPFYSANGTPPMFNQQNSHARGNVAGTSSAQPALLDRRLRGLQQQQQQGFQQQQPSLPVRSQMGMPFEVGAQQYSVNPFAPYYPIAPASHLLAGPQVPRGPARDQDPASHLRSPLLEEFRNNGKTNRRYELKVG